MLVIGSRHWVVAVRIDQPDGAEGAADAAGSPDDPGTADSPRGAEGPRVAEGHGEVDGPGPAGPGASRGSRDGAITADSDSDSARQARVDRVVEHRANVDAAYRAYAIDQAYEKVRDIERGTVTPAMKRIEAEDPERHLAGLENRLKGKDRLAEKVHDAMTERVRTVDQALATIKDAIRYTFCYADDRYAQGVDADCERLERGGFRRVDRRNSWDAEEYKGINTRWRVPGTVQLFEVQFHTEASLAAKEETHWAYEKLREPATSRAEQESLSAYQREVTTRVPTPPGALGIPDYP